jgi:AraC family transcriptional regulator of adaptative response / DNA-3-methyladenine glycosylase II
VLSAVGPVPLAFRPPLSADPLLGWFAARAVDGVSEVAGDVVRRTLRLAGGPARIHVAVGPHRVTASFELTSPADEHEALVRCRRMLDLDVDPAPVDERLRADDRMAPLVAARPGLRVAGAADPHEMALLTVLGQQISTAAARTLAGRLVARVGGDADVPGLGPHRLFPRAAAVAEADLDGLGMPARRASTVRAVAAALAGGHIDLSGRGDPAEVRSRLLALPGVGPWTADYVLLRAVGDRDALPATDLVLRQQAAERGIDLDSDSERWRPWRSYAAQHLWSASALTPRRPGGTGTRR